MGAYADRLAGRLSTTDNKVSLGLYARRHMAVENGARAAESPEGTVTVGLVEPGQSKLQRSVPRSSDTFIPAEVRSK